MDRYNVLYFICHDLGKHLGCYDTPVQSPNLDAFAASGVKFTQTFCNSPACSPARTCAVTGKYAHTTGAVGLTHVGWGLADEELTVVDHFNDAGYETAHFGFNHERHPGMNRYRIDGERHWDDRPAEAAVDKTIAYLESRQDSDAPFYCNVGTNEVHASIWSRHPERYGGPIPEDEVYVPNYSHNTPHKRAEFAKFEASIRHLDRHFARLVEAVDRLGYGENTVILFTTDHGISNGRAKGTLYDRGVEITHLMRLPKALRACLPAGSVVNALIQNIDFAPTVLEAGGIDTPADMQGRSFWPLLTGGDYEPHDAIFTERNFHGERPHPHEEAEEGQMGYVDRYDPTRAVRTPQFHYIRYFDPGANYRPWLPFEDVAFAPDGAVVPPDRPRCDEELYHVGHDPGEFVNLVGHPEYESVRADLASRLERWMRETNDHVLRGEVPKRPNEPGFGPWEGMK